jgi:LacI family transcriptional regulator
MARLRDVAHLAGYDISTVSKVLRGGNIRVTQDTRERIERAAIELGYRPNLLARSLRTHRSGAIALAVPSLGSLVYPELVYGAEEAAVEKDIVLFLLKFPATDPSGSLIQLVQDGRIDGMILADDLPSADFLEQAERGKVPVVTLNRFAGHEHYVALDDEAGFTMQAKFLLGQGHRKVAFVGVRPSSYISLLCESVFCAVYAGAGYPLGLKHRLMCGFDGEDTMDVAEKIIKLRPRPTAVAAASVYAAARLIEAFTRLGIRVPEDISVVGYHDAPIADWSVRGTSTVRMPSREQGRRSVERLLERISGKKFIGEIVSEPIELVDRGSARAPI